MKEVIRFLDDLSENNEKPWFEANKGRYLAARAKVDQLAVDLIDAIRSFDDSIGLLTPRDCTWRIYRDTRFSKDKRPYKTQMGVYVARGGKKSGFSGYYFQIGSRESGHMLAAGNYYCLPPVLKVLREDILYGNGDFRHILSQADPRMKLDLDREIRTIRTNCEGMVRMVDHFINYVRAHQEIYNQAHKAHVAVISSIAGTAGMGTAPAYSATKRMVQTYLSALVQLCRMEKYPVQFTDIRPGFVATDLLNPEKHYPMLLSREKAGDEVMKAIRKKKRIHTFDWRFRLMVFGWKCIPRWLWERFTWVKN